jgi:hypothetical protein
MDTEQDIQKRKDRQWAVGGRREMSTERGDGERLAEKQFTAFQRWSFSDFYISLQYTVQYTYFILLFHRFLFACITFMRQNLLGCAQGLLVGQSASGLEFHVNNGHSPLE